MSDLLTLEKLMKLILLTLLLGSCAHVSVNESACSRFCSTMPSNTSNVREVEGQSMCCCDGTDPESAWGLCVVQPE